MLEITRKVFKILIDGQEYSIQEPSVVQIKSLAKVSEQESFEKVIELLDELGLPKQVSESLSISALEQITDLVLPKKKS